MSMKTRITREPCQKHDRDYCWVVHMRMELNPHEWEMHVGTLQEALRAADRFDTLL